MTLSVDIVVLPHGVDLPLPAYETAGAAGLDLRAALDDTIGKLIELAPGERVLVPTGLSIALPEGYEGQIRPRSGLAVKHGITVLNAPGTIDADYRGEIHIPLINLGNQMFLIEHGMRVAQLVVAPIKQISLNQVQILPPTKRGSGGFGSTGS